MYRSMKQLFYVLTVTTILLFTGCSSDGDGASGDSTPTLPPTSAVLGSATAENGRKAAQALFDVQEFIVVSGPKATSTALQAAMSPVQAPIPPDTVINCDYGGTVAVSGDISDTSYDMSMTFSNCQMELGGLIFLSGTVREIAHFPDGYNITYIKDIYMTDVFVQVDSVNTKIYAGSRVEIRDMTDISATIELSVQSETSGEIDRLEDLVMKIAQDGDELLCYAAGDVYVDDNLSFYLQINTEYDPLCNDAFTLDLGTLISGSMELIGNDGNVSMNVTSENNITIEGIDGTVVITVN